MRNQRIERNQQRRVVTDGLVIKPGTELVLCSNMLLKCMELADYMLVYSESIYQLALKCHLDLL